MKTRRHYRVVGIYSRRLQSQWNFAECNRDSVKYNQIALPIESSTPVAARTTTEDLIPIRPQPLKMLSPIQERRAVSHDQPETLMTEEPLPQPPPYNYKGIADTHDRYLPQASPRNS